MDSLGYPDDLHYSCRHASLGIRVRTIADGRRQVRLQCATCGAAVGPALPKERGIGAPAFDEALYERTEEARRVFHSARQAEREERGDLFWRWYNEDYLSSPQWKERRSLVLRRAGGICEGCLTAPATVVHHSQAAYEQLRETGQELMCELRALCSHCHTNIAHWKQRQAERGGDQ